jgi:hypothetical protein
MIIQEVNFRRVWSGLITTPGSNQYLVFGSNPEGRHNMGVALIARLKWGAIYGVAEGKQGDSYAIVTKDLSCRMHPSISEDRIKSQIAKLYDYARNNPREEGIVGYSGHGRNLNGYTSWQMAAMYGHIEVPINIVFEEAFNSMVFHGR